ncbi:unnamed protein product, partial [Owenia fusiformis]
MSSGWLGGPPGSVPDDDAPPQSQSVRQQKLEAQRARMEEKQRKKRSTPGMVQANEHSRPKSRGARREDAQRLVSTKTPNQGPMYQHAYDGPESYELNNPDNLSTTKVQVLHVTPDSTNDYSSDSDSDVPSIKPPTNTERKLKQQSIPTVIDYEEEDDESTPINP